MSRPAATPTALLEDAKVRITRFDFVPGAETGWHRHEFDYVIVPMTPCHFLLEEPAGPRNVDMQAGAVYRRDAGVEHNVVNAGTAPMSFIEIELKPKAGAEHPSISLEQILHGGVANNEQTALKLAEALIVNLYGGEEVVRQQPLHISHDGECWRIRGAFNTDKKAEGDGAVVVSIKKLDGQVTEIYKEVILHPPPEVQEIIQKVLRERHSHSDVGKSRIS